MTHRQYLTALRTLGLGHASQLTAKTLGLTLRQIQRIAAGQHSVPPPVAKLLLLMIAHHIAPEDVPDAGRGS